MTEWYPVGKPFSFPLKWQLNIHSNFVKKQCQSGKLVYLSPAPEEPLKTSNQSLSISFLIIYSTQCTVCWQPILRMISPKSFNSLSICFNLLFQRTDLYKHSQLCLCQHHRSNVSFKDTLSGKGEKPGNHSFSLSWYHCWHTKHKLTSLTLRQPPPPAVYHGKLGAVCPCFLRPWILHVVDILIHDSAYSTGSRVPSHQIQMSASLPVLKEESLWHLIINWIKGGISGGRYFWAW